MKWGIALKISSAFSKWGGGGGVSLLKSPKLSQNAPPPPSQVINDQSPTVNNPIFFLFTNCD